MKTEGLSRQNELRLADGLTRLRPGEAEVILISGLGGPLMRKILTEGMVTAKAARTLVLSPQSEIPETRSFLQQQGFCILDEKMLFEEGNFYTVMKVTPGCQTPWTGAEREYGRHNLQEGNDALRAYVARDLRVATEMITKPEGSASPEALARLAAIREKRDLALAATQALEA